ncbi:MAG: aminotransferase class III-fold pyridoxal phosphate-dependent enzyme [Desulfobacterales bacterium]|jgi:adenosylmethionine-8-amino-7-oxononanoate aminotransferase
MTKLSERQIALLKHTFIDFQQTSEFLKNPLIIDRADGLYYWDTTGKKYFDAIGGIFVAILGHRHPKLMAAMQSQMEKITFAPPLHGTTNVTLDFIEKLAGVTPGNLNYVKPFSGGSEAIECAIKFVRQYFKQTGYPHKYKFISRYYGYHGGTYGAMAASGTGVRKTKFEPQMAGFLKVFPPNYYRDRFDTWEACNQFSAQAFEDVIVHEDPSTVAGVIVEPVGNTGGIITPTDEYFNILRNICNRHNVVLIFDEVITGIAKTGAMFAAQKFGVTPDIICCGKGISSGMVPLGAMIAREDMADAFYGMPEDDIQFAHGHTFAGNPLASAVGIAVLDEIIDNHLADKAQSLGEYLVEKLQKLLSFGVVREIRGKGILRGIELVRDTRSMEPFPELGTAFKTCALKNGLILRVDPTWFAVAPPLIAEKSDIDEMCQRIEQSLADAMEMVGA